MLENALSGRTTTTNSDSTNIATTSPLNSSSRPPLQNVDVVAALGGFNYPQTIGYEETIDCLNALYGVMADAYKWLECVRKELPDKPANLSLSEVLELYKPNPPHFSQTHIDEDWALTPQLVKDFLEAFKQDPAVFCGYTASQLTNICYAEQIASRLIDIDTEPPKWNDSLINKLTYNQDNKLAINEDNFAELLNEYKPEPLPRGFTQPFDPNHDVTVFKPSLPKAFIIHVKGYPKNKLDNLPAIFNPISQNNTDTRASICYNNLPNPSPTPQQQEPSANLNTEPLSLADISSVLKNTPTWQIIYNDYNDNRPDEILVQVKILNTGNDIFDYTPVARIYRDLSGTIQFEGLLALNVDTNYWVTQIKNILSSSGLYITRNDSGSGLPTGQITNKPSPPPSLSDL